MNTLLIFADTNKVNQAALDSVLKSAGYRVLYPGAWVVSTSASPKAFAGQIRTAFGGEASILPVTKEMLADAVLPIGVTEFIAESKAA